MNYCLWLDLAEKGSEHSLAEAIVNKAEEEKIELGEVTINLKPIAGHGVEGLVHILKSGLF